MKLNNFWRESLTALLITLLFLDCNSSGGGSSSGTVSVVAGLPNGATISQPAGNNVMTFTVNGSQCSNNSYPNKPCVTVTICNPGSTSTCQTVNDILLDTGSYGLRVFKSTISNLSLTPVTSKQGGALTECVKFGGGTADWGAVRLASVTLGGEAAITVPIQVIDSTFGSVPGSCGTPDTSPADAGFNGILGVGLFPDDCGASCNGTFTSNGRYFNCTNGNTGYGNSGSSAACAGGTSNAVTDQVQNPISSLPVDNNGVILKLPSISADGAASVTGYMVMGINTESNNGTSGVTKYQLPSSGEYTGDFQTTYNGTVYSEGFLDSGSNGYFLNSSAFSNCANPDETWFCPTSLKTASISNATYDGSTVGTASFSINNAIALFNNGAAYNDLGGNGVDSPIFDIGLPFYFGRNVYIGIEGKASSLGTGPYFAY